jgi:hypothetical protein
VLLEAPPPKAMAQSLVQTFLLAVRENRLNDVVACITKSRKIAEDAVDPATGKTPLHVAVIALWRWRSCAHVNVGFRWRAASS